MLDTYLSLDTVIIYDTLITYDTVLINHFVTFKDTLINDINIVNGVSFDDPLGIEVVKIPTKSWLEKYTPFVSFVIALISVVIALWAMLISRKTRLDSKAHNKVSVKPLLIFRPSNSNNYKKIRIYISNKGLGPLKFSEFIVFYKGRSISFYKLVAKLLESEGLTRDDLKTEFRTSSLTLNNFALNAGEEKTLFRYYIETPKDESHMKEDEMPINRKAKQIYKSILTLKFQYTYTDFYDENIESKKDDQPLLIYLNPHEGSQLK